MNEVMYINSLDQINHNSLNAHYVNILKFIFKSCLMEVNSKFILTPSWLEIWSQFYVIIFHGS